MSRQSAVVLGIVLIAVGSAALLFTLVPALGAELISWGVWRLWPVVVLLAGTAFVLPPLLVPGNRGLGGLLIPGVPVLVTGGILLFCSLSGWWAAWSWLWPLEVLAVALGFLLAALKMRVVWLVIPGIMIGANGLLLLFCVLSGLWWTWAVLWTIEPLAVGLALLAVSARGRRRGLVIAGMILCGLALLMLTGMSALFVWWWPFGLVGPALLIAGGVLLLLLGLLRRPRARPAD